MESFARSKRRNILVLILLLYVVWSVVFITQPSVVALDGKRYFSLFDDAMISMRYAWNFSHGQGLVWNLGERVEGYTNLLMTLLMSAYTGIFDKSGAVLAVSITGIFTVLSCLYIALKLCDFLIEDLEEKWRFLFKAIVFIMILTYYPFSYWPLLGMETGLLTLLILSSLYLMELYFRKRREVYLFAIAGLQGLAYLTRPDAIIFSVPIFVYLFLKEEKEPFSDFSRLKKLILMVFFYMLFIAGQEIFRISYYHEFLPNTYYLKLTGMPLLDRIKNGLGFITPYLLTHLLLLGVSIGGVSIKPDSRRKLYLVLVLLPILYQVWVGGDPWPYWRMMTPAYPLLAMLFTRGVFDLLNRTRAAISTKVGLRLASYGIAIGILASNLNFVGEMLFIQKPFETDQYESFVNTAIVLNEITTEDATVGVYYSGVIPYYTNRKAVDFLGKSDKYIARLPPDLSGAVAWSGMYSVPGHNKYDLDYSIKQLLPTYIQYPIWKGQNILSWASEHYVAVNYQGVTLWLRKGAPEVRWETLSP
ncbi:MAG TPA: hypothetical protein VK249_22710 [Anaerolineales bacterium]|nr:hypothetical protein [Anaerolineales bacterium]